MSEEVKLDRFKHDFSLSVKSVTCSYFYTCPSLGLTADCLRHLDKPRGERAKGTAAEGREGRVNEKGG